MRRRLLRYLLGEFHSKGNRAKHTYKTWDEHEAASLWYEEYDQDEQQLYYRHKINHMKQKQKPVELMTRDEAEKFMRSEVARKAREAQSDELVKMKKLVREKEELAWVGKAIDREDLAKLSTKDKARKAMGLKTSKESGAAARAADIMAAKEATGTTSVREDAAGPRDGRKGQGALREARAADARRGHDEQRGLGSAQPAEVRAEAQGEKARYEKETMASSLANKEAEKELTAMEEKAVFERAKQEALRKEEHGQSTKDVYEPVTVTRAAGGGRARAW